MKEKKKDKIARNAYKKKYKGWVKVTCGAICGCCEAKFMFKNRENAEKACKEAHLKHADITDDEGWTEQVDGFYGFNIEEIK